MAEKKSAWEKNITFQLRISADFLKTLDDWRRRQNDLPSRSEAVRRLVEAGAGSDKPDRKKKAKSAG
jgi:metal-responsive CopG/Arc/MetJ family transcriptional regulator